MRNRLKVIISKINEWFPDRWTMGEYSYEILNPEIWGDDKVGGIRLIVTRNDDNQTEVTIEFTNAECYGKSSLSREKAEQRILSSFQV